MKRFKKLLTGILAATMIMGASITAFADGNGTTVTIVRDTTYDDRNSTVAQKYYYYKILEADIETQVQPNASGEQNGVSAAYFVDEAKRNKLDSVFTFSDKASDGKYYVTGVANLTAEALAEKIKEIVESDNSGFTKTEAMVSTDKVSDDNPNADKTTLNIPDDGYYLVVSELGSKLILETWGKTNITVNEKNEYPRIDKKQKDEDGHQTFTDDTIQVGVGDTITYQVSVNVPQNASKEIKVRDTMSNGLTAAAASTITATINDNSITLEKGTQGDWTAAEGTDSDKLEQNDATPTYVITINPTSNTKGRTITFEFTATVNKNALVDTGKKNEVTLRYGEYHQEDSVEHEIFKAGLIKFDGATADVSEGNVLSKKTGVNDIKYLEGAEFELYKGETKINLFAVKDSEDHVLYYRPADSNETPSRIASVNSAEPVVIRGLDYDKSYSLKETKAPSGYNMAVADFNWGTNVLEKDDTTTDNSAVGITKAVAKLYAANNKGVTLPSTGGIGTTIFYIIGGLLIVAGVAYFLVRRKVNAD